MPVADKGLQKLSRAELIEIIYALKLSQRQQQQDNLALQRELSRRQATMQEAESIAEACMKLHGVYDNAEAAAEAYREDIRAAIPDQEDYSREIREKADREAAQIIEEARQKADRITKEAERAVREAIAKANINQDSEN